MKKFWSFLLAVLILSALPACGSNGEAESKQSQEKQSEITASGENVEDIGDPTEASSEGISFGDALDHSGEFNNYYFELEMDIRDMEEQSMKMWVMDSNIKFESSGQIIYYNTLESTMATYTEEANQVVVMPLAEMEEMETPFTMADELDRSTFDAINYAGVEDLDGKTVYAYEYSGGGFQAKYYIWADTGIIIKMETDIGGNPVSYYFKNMTLGEVTEKDFEYPASAQVIDMSSFGIG